MPLCADHHRLPDPPWVGHPDPASEVESVADCVECGAEIFELTSDSQRYCEDCKDVTCPACNGEGGTESGADCPECNGDGSVERA